MKLEMIRSAEQSLLLNTYERHPLVFVGGHDVYLVDDKGEEYLDLLSGIGVSALGYGNKAVEEALASQSRQLIHTSNLFYHQRTAELAMRLTAISGMDRVFLCNSGTEAWEAALKLARANATRLRTNGRHLGTKFLAVSQSFHGRTFGSLTTTHKLKYRQPFGPLMPETEFVELNNIEDLKSKFNSEVCAVCVEPIQGEGGIHILSREFLGTASDLCNETGALLLSDEIQCGLGRTGEWFSYQRAGIRPDVVTIAKPLANGMPIGAMLCTEASSAAFTPGMHGTTFGGNPLACAVAIAVIDQLKSRNLLTHVSDVGRYFMQCLREVTDSIPFVHEVRGEGLMIGVEFTSSEAAGYACDEMMRHKIIVNRTSEAVMRLLPPYILQRQHVDHAVTVLASIFKTYGALQASVQGETIHG